MFLGYTAKVFVPATDERDVPEDLLILGFQHVVHAGVVFAIFAVDPGVG
jgi:hypothetical protein